MTKEHMRIAIAVRVIDLEPEPDQHFNGPLHWHGKGARLFYLEDLPNYCQDLNAMHEAEKVLTPEQQVQYLERLASLIMSDAYEGADYWKDSLLESEALTFRATALQRAEAFCGVTGIWKD